MNRSRPAATPVDVVILQAGWRRALRDAPALARKAARAALNGAGATDTDRSIAIALGDDALLRDLNRRYRGKDKPTNVLSFADGTPDRLGDIALALETLKTEARVQEKTLRAHFLHLVVHGTLHLVGFDHEKPGPAGQMEALERQILTGLGVRDPYQPKARKNLSESAKKPAKPKHKSES